MMVHWNPLLEQDWMSVLQRTEIEQGRKAELSEEEIALYADHTFNYLQMAAIRKALEKGLDIEQIRSIANPWIPSWQMEEMMEELERGESPEIPARPWKIQRLLVGIGILFVVGCALSACLQPQEEVALELTASEVRISSGSEFDPSNYVKQMSGRDATLFLPDKFTAGLPGTKLVQYRLEGNGMTVKKNLRVEIVDDIEPEIYLTAGKAELLREAPFSCHTYLRQAIDNVDGDLTKKVTCSDFLSEDENQQVEYRVTDSSGNIGTASLEVHFVELIKEEEPVPMTPVITPIRTPAPVNEVREETVYEEVAAQPDWENVTIMEEEQPLLS